VDPGLRVNVVELVRRLRGVLNRVLHPLRRRRALATLRRHRRAGSVLLLCQGNICRSPFAAELLRPWLSGRGVGVDSAGFLGPGRRSPPEAIAAAARYGVDLSAHRSQLLTMPGARAADLIVVMAPEQRREVCDRFGLSERNVLVLGDLDPGPVENRTIHDPMNQPLAVFEETYARIERCLRQLERAID